MNLICPAFAVAVPLNHLIRTRADIENLSKPRSVNVKVFLNKTQTLIADFVLGDSFEKVYSIKICQRDGQEWRITKVMGKPRGKILLLANQEFALISF